MAFRIGRDIVRGSFLRVGRQAYNRFMVGTRSFLFVSVEIYFCREYFRCSLPYFRRNFVFRWKFIFRWKLFSAGNLFPLEIYFPWKVRYAYCNGLKNYLRHAASVDPYRVLILPSRGPRGGIPSGEGY